MHSPAMVIAQEDMQIETTSPDHEEKEKKQEAEQPAENVPSQNTIQETVAAPTPASSAELKPAPTSTPSTDTVPVSTPVSSGEGASEMISPEEQSAGEQSATPSVSEQTDPTQTETGSSDTSLDEGSEAASEDDLSDENIQDKTDQFADADENTEEDIAENKKADASNEEEDNLAEKLQKSEQNEEKSPDLVEEGDFSETDVEETMPDNQNEDAKKEDSKKEEIITQAGSLMFAKDVESDQALVHTAKAEVTWILKKDKDDPGEIDEDDINDIRPGYLKVTLEKSTDGWKTSAAVEGYFEYQLNEENGWKVVVENLPTEEDGNAIEYRWVWDIDHDAEKDTYDPSYDTNDYNLVGFVKEPDDISDDGTQYKRTYVHELQTTPYTIHINWDDCGDKTAEIPDELEIKLPVEITLPDGTKTDTVTLKKSDNWTLSIDLPIMHRDLDWTLSAVDGWVSGGSSTDYNDDATEITFNRRWATEEVQTAAGTSTLKVQYWIGSNEAAPMFVGVYENGQTYNVSVPRITGYRAQVSRVRGTINGNTIINVRYVPNTYMVTVYYRYLNGQTAAPTAYRSVKTGTGYTIGSPAIGGYVANVASISGTVTGRDLTYVVYYTGTGAGGSENVEVVNLNEIDDYKTPLGLGEVGINAGECFE